MKKSVCGLLLFVVVLLTHAVAPEGAFDWRKSRELAPGIRHAVMELDQPRLMKINAVRLDLKTPGLKFHTNGRAENWGEPMPDCPRFAIRTERQSTREFVQAFRRAHPETDMVIAVNATPWSPWEKPFTHKYADKLGLVVANGVMVSPPDGRPSLVIAKDGKVDFRSVKAKDAYDDLQWAVSGFNVVLRDGKVQEIRHAALAPRTGYGLSLDRRYLYWITIDGRQPLYSMGSTIREVGNLLRHFGAHDGLNMDGGGSTTLIAREYAPDGQVVLRRLNKANGERRNASNFGAYFVKGVR